MKRISVLIPVRDAAPYLRDALESVAAQTFRDLEIVAIDDGSTDGSREILRSFARREPRLRVVERENRGLIATRNELLAEAQGELVAWLDADDVALADRLELQAARFAARPALVCVGGAAQRIDPEGLLLGVELYPLTDAEIAEGLRAGKAMRFPTTTMRTDAARNVGGFREPFVLGEDLDFLTRLAEHGEMENLPEILVHYRQHLRSTSAAHGPRWQAYREAILELARERRETGTDRLQRGEPVTIPGAAEGGPGLATLDVHLRWTHEALVHGHRRSAWKHVLAALRAGPAEPRVWRMLARVAASRPPRDWIGIPTAEIRGGLTAELVARAEARTRRLRAERVASVARQREKAT